MPARHPNGFARIKKSLSRPSCVLFQFKSVFSQPVIHCVPPGHAPGSAPGARCSFVTGHTKWRDIHIGDPSNLSKMVAAVKLSARQFQWSNARISTHSPQSRRTPSLQPLAVLQRDPKGSAMMSVVGAWATVWSLILREHQPPATPLPTCRPCLLSAALRAPSCGPASACRRRGHLVPPSAVRPPLPRAHSHPPLARSRPLRSAPCIHRRA